LSTIRVSKFVPAISVILTAIFALLLPAPGQAQSWPQRAVKFVVPLGPGSGVDIGARLFADRLSARWGQPMVIENRPGGDGMVAINAFLGASDDHTLLFAPTSSFTAHPFLYDQLNYDARDFVPIARVSNTLIAMAVPASLNVASMNDLAALIRAHPGKLNWAGITGAVDLHHRLPAQRQPRHRQSAVSRWRTGGERSLGRARADVHGGARHQSPTLPGRQGEADRDP